MIRSVALNALWFDPGVSGGTETYLRQLVPELARLAPDTQFTVVTTRRGGVALRDEGWGDFVSLRVLPTDDTDRGRRTLVEQIQLPLVARRERWDVLHNLGNRGPGVVGTPSVLTLHDLIFFRDPGMAGLSRFAMRTLTKRAVRRADRLIALTEAAAADMRGEFGLDPALITVIPHGVGRAAAAEPMPEQEVRERHGLGSSRVVLCVAAKRPHKNQELLLRALEHLPGDVMLVCVGHEEGYEVRLRELVSQLGIDERVRLPGYLPDAELEGLWRLAACAAFPTRAEGFGLPVLEAMQRGLPVACSHIPVLREVGGDAAVYFDPDDPAGAARAIEECLADPERAERGRRRSEEFSWARAAERTLGVYERALASATR